jgi:hypothetical protein
MALAESQDCILAASGWKNRSSLVRFLYARKAALNVDRKFKGALVGRAMMMGTVCVMEVRVIAGYGDGGRELGYNMHLPHPGPLTEC